MSGKFQAPPTYALPVIVDERTGKSTFNPLWLSWFLALSQGLGSQGAGSGTITQLDTGAGLTGGPVTETGTIALASVGTAGTYPKVTTNAYGQVVSGAAQIDLATDVTGTLAPSHLGGVSATVTLAKLTTLGTNGSLTFTNGLLTAYTAAT